MSELRPERQLLSETLAHHGMTCFVYEDHAGARPASIERTYLSELETSDLYVGIFWVKYGECTIQEYAKAREFGKPRLIYQKGGEGTQRDSKLGDFLRTIGDVHGEVSPCLFSDPLELPERVHEDIMRVLSNRFREGQNPSTVPLADGIEPSTLPCLCDRDPQDKSFNRTVVQHVFSKGVRPVLLILDGHKMEGHRLYVTRLEAKSLFDAMAIAGLKGKPKILNITAPLTESSSPVALSEEVGMLLAGKLRVVFCADHGFVFEYMKREQIKTLLVVFTINSSDYAAGQHQFITRLYEVFALYPDLSADCMIGILVCVKHEQDETAFQKDVTACKTLHQQTNKVTLIELPRLKPVSVQDASQWLERDEVKRHLHDVPLDDVEAMFEGKLELPMEELFGKMQLLITKRSKNA